MRLSPTSATPVLTTCTSLSIRHTPAPYVIASSPPNRQPRQAHYHCHALLTRASTHPRPQQHTFRPHPLPRPTEHHPIDGPKNRPPPTEPTTVLRDRKEPDARHTPESKQPPPIMPQDMPPRRRVRRRAVQGELFAVDQRNTCAFILSSFGGGGERSSEGFAEGGSGGRDMPWARVGLWSGYGKSWLNGGGRIAEAEIVREERLRAGSGMRRQTRAGKSQVYIPSAPSALCLCPASVPTPALRLAPRPTNPPAAPTNSILPPEEGSKRRAQNKT